MFAREYSEKVIALLTFSVKCESEVTRVTLSAFAANDFMVITSLGDGRCTERHLFPKQQKG